MDTGNDFSLPAIYRKYLMGFAALWILIFHEWKPIFSSGILCDVERFVKGIGFCGVDIFFFLSGMGMYFSAKKHSVPQFYYRRIRRIVVPFLIVGLLCYRTMGWTFEGLIKNISGINFYTVSIYCFLWFVPAICTFYLVFPLYYRWFSCSANKMVFTLNVLTLWLMCSLAFADIMRPDLFGFTNRIPIFCAGCLVGHRSEQWSGRFDRDVWFFFILELLLGLYLGFLTNYKGMPLLVPTPNCCVPNFLMASSLAFLIPKGLELLGRAAEIRIVEQTLLRVLGFLGTFSLELYCVQEWMGEVLYAFVRHRFPVLVINIFIFAGILVAGFALYLAQKLFWNIFDRAVAFGRGRES